MCVPSRSARSVCAHTLLPSGDAEGALTHSAHVFYTGYPRHPTFCTLEEPAGPAHALLSHDAARRQPTRRCLQSALRASPALVSHVRVPVLARPRKLP